jgi:hypothetical protein
VEFVYLPLKSVADFSIGIEKPPAPTKAGDVDKEAIVHHQVPSTFRS